MKKNILVGQSGGPTAVINSSLYGVLKAGRAAQHKVIGMVNGIEGFLQDQVLDLSCLSDQEAMLLRTTPAAYLGSCRYKLPEDLSHAVYAQIFEQLNRYHIGYFLYIGGNDSMDTVSKLSRYAKQIHSDIRFIGIPKTIDNDLIMTDHTPGFGSAAKFVASMVRQMVLDSEVYHTKSVTIVEIMGRSAGWLTAASVLARKYEGDNPVLIYLPEADFDLEDMLIRVKTLLESKQNLIICVSEGIHDQSGKLICEYEQEIATDVFGHKNLTGCGKILENTIKQRLGVKVRSVELNITQRSNAIEASLTDVEEGADLLIVKPALAYQDIIRQVADLVNIPVAAYSVSGEYDMVKAGAKLGYVEESRMIAEMAIGAYRAGASVYITYFAEEIAGLMDSGVIG